MERLLFSLLLVATSSATTHIHKAVETEMFSIPISPNLFNWTYQEFDEQYRFHASLLGKPELPPWLRYMYSGRHHSGFIFGTPPLGVKSQITLEVIGLNRQDYETRRVTLILKISGKERKAQYEVELKIDNLNVEDLLDEHRMDSLKDILKTKLWKESTGDLYTTFLASAIDLGARLPLKPSDGEGLVVRLGSWSPFSEKLNSLREEVRPLSRLPSCPREYKRTSVERIFRSSGFTLDWCRFKLYNPVHEESGGSRARARAPAQVPRDPRRAPLRHALPVRGLARQLAAAAAGPLALLLLAAAALTAVLCFQYAAVRDPESEYFFDNIFHICIDYRNRRANKPSQVEICRYGTGNTEQTQVPDNNSGRSLKISPNSSLARPYSPKSSSNLAGSYNRPQPPPYTGSTTNSLHHRKSGNTDSTGHTPDHNRHLLEESLKLLNEANISSELDLNVPISKEPIVDYADGADDYVPIKDGVFYKGLDDIDAPELSKFGVAGVGNIF